MARLFNKPNERTNNDLTCESTCESKGELRLCSSVLPVEYDDWSSFMQYMPLYRNIISMHNQRHISCL